MKSGFVTLSTLLSGAVRSIQARSVESRSSPYSTRRRSWRYPDVCSRNVASVEIRTRADPLEQGAGVLVGAVAQHAVVELREGLAVAGRATDVGEDDRDPELVHVIVVAAQEARPRLSFRPPVDVDDHRAASGEASRWLMEEARDGAAVEAWPRDEVGLGRGGWIGAGRPASRPAGGRAGWEVGPGGVGGGARRAARE